MSREDYQRLSARLVEVAQLATARGRQIEDLKRELREAWEIIAQGGEALKVGRQVMAQFPSREAFEEAFGSEDSGALQPGQSPLSDLAGWRAGQLGGVRSYVIKTPPDNR